jgi:hypothetical protein
MAKYLPGVSGNPKGRPRGDMGMREVARTYGVEMIELLVAKARKGNVPAMCEVLSRGFGRPEQSVDLRMLFERKLTDLTEGELIELRSRMSALTALPAPVIEHHETDGEE